MKPNYFIILIKYDHRLLTANCYYGILLYFLNATIVSNHSDGKYPHHHCCKRGFFSCASQIQKVVISIILYNESTTIAKVVVNTTLLQHEMLFYQNTTLHF